MGLSPPPRGLPGRAGLAGLLACIVWLSGAGPVQAAAELAARVAAARADGGIDPRRAVQSLRRLRDEARAAGLLAERLQADEAECRVLTDIDGRAAIAVADAGLAAAGPAPAAALRAQVLRLRACRAGMLIDLSQRDAGLAELEALLALPADELPPAARAIALLERGVALSRMGEFQRGQQDLLEACLALQATADERDRDLCNSHLANHYRRVGDSDEALRLLRKLHERARQAGAVFDQSIYVYGMAQIHGAQRRWPEALAAFRESAALSDGLQDPASVGFAEAGVAEALHALGQTDEALQHIRRAQALVPPEDDPRQHESRSVFLAQVLVALGRHAEALATLESVRDAVRAREDRRNLVDWLETWARCAGAQGRHRQAYEALEEAMALQHLRLEQLVSEQSARMRMQFNRERDAEELATLRALNEQGERLRNTQALALGLFLALLGGLATLALRKMRQARRLGALASIDELTGLANRRALLARAGQQIERCRSEGGRLALLMLDIDHFKRVNDTHGHPVGDAVLRQAAQLLGACLRERDSLGRVGGEEFVAVLPDTTPEAALQVAERMRAAVAAAALELPGDGSLRYTVSIGVAALRAGEGAEALIARADAALYQAKRGGRNRVEAAAG